MTARPTKKTTPRRRSFPWARWTDRDLLELRLSQLNVQIHGTWLEPLLARLQGELDRRHLLLHPHFWLSTEFFTPSGVPGVAIPFYLAHPRLMRLERKQMHEVEGGTERDCMKILRHEVGHALQHGFLLQRRRRWQQLFGRSSTPYPQWYRPRPRSRRFVHYLDYWYAQSHPDEDFAETFAVWLDPRSNWRKRYAAWPAFKKLVYVDETMQAMANTKPTVRTKTTIEPLRSLKKTLGEHYQDKRQTYSLDYPDIYDPDLRRIFSEDPKHRRRETAASFLRRNRAELRRIVSRCTSEYEFAVDAVLRDMIGRCRVLKLRAHRPDREIRLDFVALLTMQTMSYLYSGRHVHAL